MLKHRVYLYKFLCWCGVLLLSSTLYAQDVTIINNYGDTTDVGKDGMRLKSTGTHTLVINYYEPAPKGAVDRLEELIGQSIDFYLDQIIAVNDEELGFKKSRKQVLKDLNAIVSDAVKYYDFKEVNEFKGFSDRVEEKIDDIDGKEWRKSELFVRNADEGTKKEMLYYFAQKEVNELKLLANTEVGNYSNDNLLALAETAVKGLSDDEQEALLNELKNFQKNDELSPMEVDFSSATITLLASEDEFVLPQMPTSQKGPDESTFEERVMRLLEENQRRMDRMENDIAELKKDRIKDNTVPPSISGSSDPALQAQIDEIRLMLAEILKRENRPVQAGKDVIISNEGALVYNLPDKVVFNFSKAGYSLDLGSKLMLNEIIDILAHQPSLNLMVTGYADKTGDPKNNLILSRKRAEAVKSYLVKQGINSDRIIMNYFGDRQSYIENPNDRKVEVEFLRF